MEKFLYNSTLKKFIETPIPKQKTENWEKVRQIEINECNEKLVPVNLYPEKIINHPEYFIQGIKHSLPVCYVRENVYEKLILASSLLPPNYKLVILDAFRPVEVQETLFNKYKDKLKLENPNLSDKELTELTLKFVALPSFDEKKPSPHNTGGSVDLTICDDKGRFLRMGTDYDDMSDLAITRFYEEKVEKQEKLSKQEEEFLINRRILYHLMNYVGFTNFSNEWWHYDFGNQLWAYHKEESFAIYGRSKPSFFWWF